MFCFLFESRFQCLQNIFVLALDVFAVPLVVVCVLEKKEKEWEV